MRILLLGINYAPEPIGIAVYTAGLCETLAAMGHEVRVVAAKPYYPQWRVADAYRGGGWSSATEEGVRVTRCPLYVPAAPTGLKRVLHHASFALSAFCPLLREARRFKPDIVMTVAPSLIAAPLARLAARFARARTWLHIQDFEVEAAFATGVMSGKSRLARLARRFERTAIAGFDGVSSISLEMCRKLPSMGVPAEKVYELRNWADLTAVKPLAGPSGYRRQWNITTPHVALYSGNIGHKQGIEIVVEAARLLRHRADLRFVLCGEGPNRTAVEALAEGLGNVEFRDLQPTERLAELLGLATIHLLPQKADAADLVLPSKLTNMLASGRPVVATAAPGTGLAREVEGCGLVTPPGDSRSFADAVEQLVEAPERHRAFSVAARQRAEQAWDRRSIITAFERQLRVLVEGLPAGR